PSLTAFSTLSLHDALPIWVLLLGLAFGSIGLHAQAVDPGVRAGSIDGGGPLPGLSAGQSKTFALGLATFATARSINGGLPNQPQEGLGPRFNSNSCSSCHSQPAVGGTSPS